MSFPIFYFVAAFSAALVSGITLPVWRSWAQKTGLVDDPGHRKIHYVPVPLAGGLAVFTGIAVPLLAGAILLWLPAFDIFEKPLLIHGMHRRAGQLAVLLLGTLAVTAIGWLDDKVELKPGAKFSAQMAVALGVALSGIRITLFIHNAWIDVAITVFWILSITNAFNIMDNMNGLCSGLAVIGAWFFGWTAAIHGQYLVSILSALFLGSLIGFLPYNFPNASVFLGDAGSHLVGFWLAVLAILPDFYKPFENSPWAVLCPLFFLAVPLGDMICVMYIRWKAGMPVYRADNNHLSHRLVRRGYSRTAAVLLIWLMAALIASAGFALWMR